MTSKLPWLSTLSLHGRTSWHSKFVIITVNILWILFLGGGIFLFGGTDGLPGARGPGLLLHLWPAAAARYLKISSRCFMSLFVLFLSFFFGRGGVLCFWGFLVCSRAGSSWSAYFWGCLRSPVEPEPAQVFLHLSCERRRADASRDRCLVLPWALTVMRMVLMMFV